MNTLETAAHEYIKRKARNAHPVGKFDGEGRWTPSNGEERSCCSDVRPPSRSWPFSLLTHCRTLKHIAKLYDVNETDLRRTVREIRQAAGEEK